MFDVTKFDFSFRPDFKLEDNAGRFWNEDDEGNLQQYMNRHLKPGAGSNGEERISYLGEVDVASMGVESTLSDVYWITLHRDGDNYRLVFRSEIPENDELQPTQPMFHKVPSFGELIYALDHIPAEVFDTTSGGWVQGTIELVSISTIYSNLYPQLENWYLTLQDHFFMTGEMVYVCDPKGSAFKSLKLSVPNPDRRNETIPGSGSVFSAAIKQPGSLKRFYDSFGSDHNQ